MRALLAVPAVLVGLVALAAPASALCHVMTVPPLGIINYATLCAADEQWIGEPDFGYGWNYVAHLGHAVSGHEPVAGSMLNTWAFATVGQGTFRYVNDEHGSAYTGEGTDANFVVGHSYQPLGTGYGVGAYGGVAQQRERATNCTSQGQCEELFRSDRTVSNNGAYVSVRDGPSLGASVNYYQDNTSEGCHETGDVQVDLVGTIITYPTFDEPCTHALPNLYDSQQLPHWPTLPPL